MWDRCKLWTKRAGPTSSEITRMTTPRRCASWSSFSMRSSEIEKMATSREVVAEAKVLDLFLQAELELVVQVL